MNKIHLFIPLILIIIAHHTYAQTCRTEQEIPSSTPSTRFLINADGTVLDKLTNLMWMQCSIGQSGSDCSTGSATAMNWRDALSNAENSMFANYSNWQLPNVKELFTLVEQRCFAPSINSDVFPNTANMSYWTSSPDVGLDGNAWSITSYGAAFRNDESFFYSVRLVREL